MSCGVGHKHGSDPTLLWLCRRPVATAPIRTLAWEPPYAVGLAQEMTKRQKEKQKKRKKIKKRKRKRKRKRKEKRNLPSGAVEIESINLRKCLEGKMYTDESILVNRSIIATDLINKKNAEKNVL